jgi:hypothetical protein
MMAEIKHMIVPYKGTQLVQHGMTIDQVVEGVGNYEEIYDASAGDYPFLGYFWHQQDLQVRVDPQTRQVNWIMFCPKADLYLGDVRVFDMPNLIVLFAMHDPHPLEVCDKVVYTRLGLQIEIPMNKDGYATMHTGTGSFFYVMPLSAAKVEYLNNCDPPLPEYDWKRWLKRSPDDVYVPPPEEG